MKATSRGWRPIRWRWVVLLIPTLLWIPVNGLAQAEDNIDELMKTLQRENPIVRRIAIEESSGTWNKSSTAHLISELERVGTRIEKRYGLTVDCMKYDIMDLLDIEARMEVRHRSDTIETLLGDVLTDADRERNKGLFGQK